MEKQATGYRIISLGSVDSTNAEALRQAAKGASDRTVVVAETQTAGRGRLDRRWHSPSGTGLYFSILLRLPHGAAVSLVPLAAGVAVVRAVKRVAGVDARIKWPNDIHIAGGWNKVCGILTEAADNGRVVVVGIGVNVSKWQEPIPEDVAKRRAVTLEDVSGQPVDHGVLLKAILSDFENLLEELRRGKSADIIEAVRDVHEPFGSEVCVVAAGSETRGIASGIDDDGRFVLELPDGTRRAFVAGDVELIRPVK